MKPRRPEIVIPKNTTSATRWSSDCEEKRVRKRGWRATVTGGERQQQRRWLLTRRIPAFGGKGAAGWRMVDGGEAAGLGDGRR
ncbi:hypothetical protein A4A49_14810 [Nicotiana attenuata]|uniref:Uncharacterized protein n=1 Tax=Nicotiana attenuata TaxID=49451 RepID=A0A314KUX6_NICAT|nr:hypothetical protein A4A49_14810 [Nicotiana attenuata]